MSVFLTLQKRMNKILSGDKIKALAVSILDDQKTSEIFACQSGSTLMKIDLKNANFDSIPFRTLIFLQGTFIQEPCKDESYIIEVDLSKADHRFVSLKSDTIKLYKGLSVFDILEGLPNLSDTKPFPQRTEFEHLYLFLLQRQAHNVKLIREAVECGDFGNTTPKYIQGQAYEKIFTDYKIRTGYKPKESGMIQPARTIKTKQSVQVKSRPQKIDDSVSEATKIMVSVFKFAKSVFTIFRRNPNQLIMTLRFIQAQTILPHLTEVIYV